MSELVEILKYEGEITFDKIEYILTLFNQNLPNTVSMVCKTRLFSIMVECLENAYRHNYRSPEQNPQIKIELNQNGDKTSLTVGNLINNNELPSLTNRIDELNLMDIAEIKKKYNDTIKKTHISEKGGAGLGLLKILRSTKEPLKYSVTKIDNDCSFINITITITDNN